MRFLLDTHTLLWTLISPEELSARVRTIMADRASELLISIVVPWEMAIKTASGKLKASGVLADFDTILASGGYTLLETTVKQVIDGGSLPLHHRDPFDRLLIAQSFDLHVPLLSCDEIFDRYGVSRIWN